VVVTTSRGLGNTLAMAEYAVAGILYFAKDLHRAAVDRAAGAFDHRAYRPLRATRYVSSASRPPPGGQPSSRRSHPYLDSHPPVRRHSFHDHRVNLTQQHRGLSNYHDSLTKPL
jgi:hypothetical protein